MLTRRHCIVAALDLGEHCEIVLEHAIDQAAHHAAVDLHVVHVLAPGTTELADVKRALTALVEPALERLRGVAWRLHLHVRSGDAPAELTDLAAELRADLLVIGRFGAHHPHRRIGLTASRVIDRATCPTFVVGLTDQSPDAQPGCPACVQLRAETEGRLWFCEAHAAPGRLQLSSLISDSASWSGGGLLW